MRKQFLHLLLLTTYATVNAAVVRSQTYQEMHVKPFSLVCEAHMGYGPKRMDSLVTFARRSDGSYVRTYTDKSPDGETGTVVEVLDTHKRTFSILTPFTQLATTVLRYEKDSDAEIQRQAQFWGTCKDYEAHGVIRLVDSMLGYQVMKVLEFSPGTSGNAVLSSVAPTLDCYPLRLTIAAGEGAIFEVGSGTTTAQVPVGTVINDQIVTKVVEGEPSDEMFKAPLEYGDVSFEDFGATYFSKYGVGWYGYHVKRYELIYGRRLDSFLH